MKTGRVVGIVVTCVLLITLVSVLLTAIGIGGEASKLDSLLKSDVNAHIAYDALNKQIAEENFKVSQPAAPSMHAIATGPEYRALLYKTWLTLDVSVDGNGQVVGYHLDRASGWF